MNETPLNDAEGERLPRAAAGGNPVVVPAADPVAKPRAEPPAATRPPRPPRPHAAKGSSRAAGPNAPLLTTRDTDVTLFSQLMTPDVTPPGATNAQEPPGAAPASRTTIPSVALAASISGGPGAIIGGPLALNLAAALPVALVLENSPETTLAQTANANVPAAPAPAPANVPATPAVTTPAPFVKAEANLLRFPFFALKTKGLKAVTGYECRGKLTRDGVTYKFTYRTSRNVETPYPGALSRSVHLAFLTLLTEQGTPLKNPITWTWRDLCRRMGITCSGRAINDLKQAILATRGVIIFSDQALYSKPDSKPICTQKEAVGLYERVVFVGTDLPDGEGTSDRNFLWLSAWYLDNLNALFTAPLNHELWLTLEQRSSIASRLYEFLLLNFHGTSILRITYEKLAKFLPVRVEKHLSQAKQQLGGALELLVAMKVLEAFEWQRGKNGTVLLQFHRGVNCGLQTDPDPANFDLVVDEDLSQIEVKEKRLPPEYLIVDEFNRQWQRSTHTEPTAKEMALAKELMTQYGASKLRVLIPAVIKKLKAKWPDAKSFGSVSKYIGEVAAFHEREQARLALEQRQGRDQRQNLLEQGSKNEEEKEDLKKRWDALPEAVRAEITEFVHKQNPKLKSHTMFFEATKLEEMRNRGL